jgi:hypothetical protein
LLPLTRERERIGSLNLGAERADRFRTNMGTDFLRHFAAIASLCIDATMSRERLKYLGLTDALTGIHNRRFFDQRLSDPLQYPVSARSGSWNTRGTPDLVTGKLAPLHAYQLSLKAPKPPAGSFDAAAAERAYLPRRPHRKMRQGCGKARQGWPVDARKHSVLGPL